MFENAIKALEQMGSKPMTVSFNIALDDKGCIDRICPAEPCGRHFKVVYADWKDKVSDPKAFCPYCRHEQSAQSWNTPAQNHYYAQVALSHVSGILNKAFATDSRQQRSRNQSRPKGGLIDISFDLDYTPGHPPVAVMPEVAEILRQEFTCEKCQCRWSSLGSSFYCPACGHNSAVVEFERTLNSVRSIVNRVPEMTRSLNDKDEAEDTSRNVIEAQLGKLVGAFERMNEVLSDRVLPAKQPPKKGAVFQRVDDASDWWRTAVGVGFDQWLNQNELDRFRLLYQRRHLLVHRQGVVDQKYLTVSGDRAYSAEQRIAVRGEDILELADMQEKIFKGLTGVM